MIGFLLLCGLPVSLAAQDGATEVVVLGVAHSAMLVAPSYQPAVFRAWLDRAEPDAICVERPPEELARGSHYEFTYEIQEIAIPYARERRIPICPFDWLPDLEDQMLAFNINLEEPPFVRSAGSYGNFTSYSDSSALDRDLFYAEAEHERQQYRDWYAALPDQPRGDFARRLFLYRTFMQAMRIARAAKEHPGGRVVVLVGSMHKDDIERILSGQHGVRVVPPSTIGAPSPSAVAAAIRDEDLAAIATFNLLGVQSTTGNVNWEWIDSALDRLESSRPGSETALLRTRYRVLHEALPADAAARAYASIAASADADARFTWTGVMDARRIDSFADPFGNLTIRERALLEEAREHLRGGRTELARERREELARGLTPLKLAQLNEYWDDWIQTD